jgi:hypothetical protein
MLNRYITLLMITTMMMLSIAIIHINAADVSLCGIRTDDTLPAIYNGSVAYIPSDSYITNTPIVRILSGQMREEISIPVILSDTIRLRMPRLSPNNTTIIMRPRSGENALILWNIRTGNIDRIELDAQIAFYLTGENEDRTGRSYPPFTTAIEWIDEGTFSIRIPNTMGAYTQYIYRIGDYAEVDTIVEETTIVQDLTTYSKTMPSGVTVEVSDGTAMQLGYLRIVEPVSERSLYTEPDRYRGDLQQIGDNFIIYTVRTDTSGIQPVLIDTRLEFPQQNKFLSALVNQFGQDIVSSGATPAIEPLSGRIAFVVAVRQLATPAVDVLTVYDPYRELLTSYCVQTLNFSLFELAWLSDRYLALVRYGSPMIIYDLLTGDSYHLNGDLLNF